MQIYKLFYKNIVFLLFLLFGCQSNTNEKGEMGNNPNNSIDSKYNINELFNKKRLSLPVDSLIIVLFKKEQKLTIYASKEPNSPIYIKHYPLNHVFNAGPKLLKEDDKFPEGIYGLSADATLSYPNAFDRRKASADNRTLSATSLPFLPFVERNQDKSEIQEIIKRTGYKKTSFISLPGAFSNASVPSCTFCPSWYSELYGQLKMTMEDYDNQ